MSHHTMLPALTRPWIATSGHALSIQLGPALTKSAIDSLRPNFPGTLTVDHEQLLRHGCGIDGTPLQYIDFTGQWHGEEPLGVFRPCITLAIDAAGRRWIAETGNTEGLPGPVWCILEDPQVAVYVAEKLGGFLEIVHQHTVWNSFDGFQRAIDTAARRIWQQRGALAFQSRQECGSNRDLRAWLLQLPRDARVYDLRSPLFGAGWPYGSAGPAGRFHRCGRQLLFAVSGFPAPSRWMEHLGKVAQQHVAPRPAIIAAGAYHVARADALSHIDAPTEERLCA
jgi:hypothetical protein